MSVWFPRKRSVEVKPEIVDRQILETSTKLGIAAFWGDRTQRNFAFLEGRCLHGRLLYISSARLPVKGLQRNGGKRYYRA
ncbi:MAG: hypothetical protein ACOYMQ_12735 [Pseudanabaena sp.]